MRTRSIVVLAVTLLLGLLTAATAAEALSTVVHQTEDPLEDVLLSRIAALERDTRRLDAELSVKEKEDLRERLETSVAHAAKLLSEIEAVTSSTTLSAETGVHPPVATIDDEGAVGRRLKGTKKNKSPKLTKRPKFSIPPGSDNGVCTEAKQYYQYYLDNCDGGYPSTSPSPSVIPTSSPSATPSVEPSISAIPSSLPSIDTRCVNFVPDANLSGCDLSGADLEGADLKGADLNNVDLTNADLEGADLTGAGLYTANLLDANLSDADLEGADLENANLAFATLTGADLTDATLENANLTNARLTDADLTRADLENADLTNARLTGEAKLLEADLEDADLSGADLTGATLAFATLTGADLTDADLTNADLTFAVLDGVTWSNTTCPDGNPSNDKTDGTCESCITAASSCT